MNEKTLDNLIVKALTNTAIKISRYNNSVLPDENPVVQLSRTYFVVNTNSQIDSAILRHYLAGELDMLNVGLDYGIAIYDCNRDTFLLTKKIPPPGKNIAAPENQIRELFQKHNGFIYYFGVVFPNKKQYLYQQMTIWTIFSSLLLLMIVFFAYALFVIFRQKQFSELQKDFINNMTHEFKTPISTISIASNVLSEKEITDQPDRLMNYASIIKQENSRLNELVEKVLQIARIEKRGLHLKPEKINLHELIDKIFQHNGLINKQKNVTLEKSLHAERYEIKADKVHLTNVLFSLFDNSVKYSYDSVRIELKTVNSGKYMLFSFSDNGKGIPHEYRKKVFHKFFRVPAGNIHDIKGFGLGLFYVKHVCHAHNWSIQLDSEMNKGTTFTIKMPVY